LEGVHYAGREVTEHVYARPSEYSPEELQALNAMPRAEALRQMKRLARLDGGRADLPTFTPDAPSFTALKDLGPDAWIDEVQGERKASHKPTMGNWQATYIPTRQPLKQVTYNHEDALRHGQIAWHSAALQSEILHLDRARRILGGASPVAADLT